MYETYNVIFLLRRLNQLFKVSYFYFFKKYIFLQNRKFLIIIISLKYLNFVYYYLDTLRKNERIIVIIDSLRVDFKKKSNIQRNFLSKKKLGIIL